jgi:hypothetical protein
MRIVVIGNPEKRRIVFFLGAARHLYLLYQEEDAYFQGQKYSTQFAGSKLEKPLI